MDLGSFLSRRLTLMAPLAAMLAILALSSVPGVIPDDASVAYQVFVWVPPTIQNLMHIPVYGGLTFLWCWALKARLGVRRASHVALAIAVGFGVFDEWYQSFIPGRNASLLDVLLNTIGALLGVWVFRRLSKGAGKQRA